MPRRLLFASLLACLGLLAALALPFATPAAPQQVVDRIAARIDDDVITTSEIQELAAYQQLVDGKAQPEQSLLSEIIEQWVVRNEATSAQFPPAAESEVSREVAGIESHFSSPAAYQQRLSELGMTADTVRRIVAEQIFLGRYLDYKFRTTVQVSDMDVENYYQQQLVPQLTAQKQPVPPLDQVREQIRELLVQRGISEHADAWFEETKSRLNIEIEPAAGVAAKSDSHE